MKPKYWLLSIIGFFLLLLGIGKKVLFSEAVYIAVAGPLSEMNGIAMKQGIQLYLDKINRQGGIEGKQLKLLEFDDNKVEPEKQALKIINSKALAVIGHYTSETSLKAAPIYQQYGVPAITATATADKITKGNDWYFRVIFNNSAQGAVLANYVYKILGYKKAYIFFDERDYGYTLTKAFTQTANLIGLTIGNQWDFNQDNFENRLDEMINTLKQDKENFILFLAIHSAEAVETLVGLRRLTRKIPIIGGDAFSNSLFMNIFHKFYPQERLHPGYYTNGVYTVSQLLIDSANKSALDFKHAFIDKYKDINNIITAALYYDAAMVAVDAIDKMLKKERVATLSKAEQRQRVKENLRHLSKLEAALEGVTGYLYFDKNGDAIKPISLGIYKNGKLMVNWYQYQPLNNLKSIKNLLQEVLDNEIISVNEKFMRKVQIVYIGIDFNDIRELNVRDSTYVADFYLWFRFKEHANKKHRTQSVHSINFLNLLKPEENELKSKEKVIIADKILSINEEKTITETYRLKRKFKIDFDFSHYPLDKQILPIRFRHDQWTNSELVYVVDTDGMRINNLGEQTVAEKVEIEKVFSIGDWQIDNVSFFQNSQKNDSTLGLPDLFDSQQRLEYSQFNVEISIKRFVWSFILKTLLPIIFVVGLGYAVYFTNVFAVKMTLSINMILSTSLFHLKLASALAVGYNILIEYVFYLVYMMGIFGVVISLIFNAKNEEQKKIEEKFTKIKETNESNEKEIKEIEEKIAKNKSLINRIDLWGKIGYPIVFLSAIVIIFYDYLF